MRMPVGLANMYWTADCKYLTGMNMEFQWHENKLFSGKRIFGPDFFLIRVAIDPVGKPPPHIKPLEAWQFEPALPHPKYPIEFYPRTAWVGPDNPKTKYPPPALWGVRGTMDPQTRRPYRTGCNISPLDANRPESVVESDFPRDYGDAKCVGGIPVVNGKSSVSVRVEIPATGMPHIDRIYNAVSEFITPLVLE